MADRQEDFLARWSRRKAAVAEEEPKTAEQAAPAEAESAGALDEAQQKALVESLPDIDSMDEKSDFSVFMQEGVPDALRRRALRRLWRVNPVFANLDGLNDYDDDFTDAAMVVEGMKTLFQVGKGMADRTAPADDEAPADGEAPAEAEAEEPDEAEPGAELAESEAEDSEAEVDALAAPMGDAELAALEPEPREAIAATQPAVRPAHARRWGLPES